MNPVKLYFIISILIIPCLVLAGPLTQIPGLYNTGVDNENELLAGGETDLHYKIISSSDNNFPGPEAKVVISDNYPMNVWIENNNRSKWIAPRADAGNSNERGVYIYRITFDLRNFKPNTAVIKGIWTTDDNGVDILINGRSTENFTPLSAFYGMFPFVINSGFTDGINTVDFVVNNVVSSSGIRVEINGEAEPKNYALILTTPHPPYSNYPSSTAQVSEF